MQKPKILNLHLISDGVAQTPKHVAAAALSYFDKIPTKYYYWPLINNRQAFNKCINKVKIRPGVVIHTMWNKKLKKALVEFCKTQGIPCISVVEGVVSAIRQYVDIPVKKYLTSELHQTYFDKVQAMDFALNHDDGKSLETIHHADVIIVGVSRSSKTPTSIYLAYNGYKTANIPYIKGIPMPQKLTSLRQHNMLIVGLILQPSSLLNIRMNRSKDMNIDSETDYTNLFEITQECNLAKQYFLQYNWPVIDVTLKSIEETAAEIMRLIYNRKHTYTGGIYSL